VSEPFVYHFDKSSGGSWYPLSAKEVDRCTIWCFTITWPERQGDGLNVLQIGFEEEQLAQEWHRAVVETIETDVFGRQEEPVHPEKSECFPFTCRKQNKERSLRLGSKCKGR
jgi:hypothetical protein